MFRTLTGAKPIAIGPQQIIRRALQRSPGVSRTRLAELLHVPPGHLRDYGRTRRMPLYAWMVAWGMAGESAVIGGLLAWASARRLPLGE